MDQILADNSIKKILSNTEIKKINISGKKIVIDHTTEEELSKRYGIKGVQTLILVDYSGNEVFHVTGLLTKEDFKDILCNYVKIANKGCN